MNLPEGAVFEKVAIENIEATAATQVRVRIDRGMVDEYTEAFQDGAAFPPLDCFREEGSERIILADGFHRHRAAINAGREEIGCIIYTGGLHDALVHALGSNAEHGFRRTNADKRHAVEMALKDPELSKLEKQEIAEICRVHRNTVRRILNDLIAQDSSNNDDATKVQDNSGKVEEPSAEHVRESGEVTQQQVETDELRQALKHITVLPYPGEDGPDRLDLDPDLVADCEYVSTWLASLVITYRNKEGESDDGA